VHAVVESSRLPPLHRPGQPDQQLQVPRLSILDQLNRLAFELVAVAGDAAHGGLGVDQLGGVEAQGRDQPEEHTQRRRILAAIDVAQRHHGYADLCRQHLLRLPVGIPWRKDGSVGTLRRWSLSVLIAYEWKVATSTRSNPRGRAREVLS
jgi:hypothetical protein